jgi:cis-3-alkyl-4-acyloxetan-2-one decarboxylase
MLNESIKNNSWLQNEYPFESHFIGEEGIRQHYVDEGEGSPVLMVHGNPTWSFYYRNLIKQLKSDHRVIVPDHVGCGLSDKPNDNQYHFTLKSRIDDLEKLVDHCGIKEGLTLIVHDWGGMIGMGLAVRRPELINKFVILNTSAFHLPESKPMPLALKICRQTTVGSLMALGLNAFSRAANITCVTREKLSKETKQAYLAPYDSWNNRRAVLRFVQDIPLAPGDEAYDTVSNIENNLEQFANIPMLIVWGAKDWCFDDHFLAKWTVAFPQAELHRIADAGHYILEDAPTEVRDLLGEFMKEKTLH